MMLRKTLMTLVLAGLVLNAVSCMGKDAESSRTPTNNERKEKTMRGTAEPIVRHAGGAGVWYPSDSEELRREIHQYLAAEEQLDTTGEVVALVSPHAGYVYSGPVAAAAFRQVQGRSYDTVVCVGLSHRVPIRKASVFTGDFYETPLGKVPIDKKVVQNLLEKPDTFEYVEDAHETRPAGGIRRRPGGEHSVENQLPFLQVALEGDFEFVEILINAEDPQLCKQAGQALASALKDRKSLLVASTDLTHWPEYQDAVRVDKRALEILEKFDDIESIWPSLRRLEKENVGVPNLSCVMCSKAAVMTVFEAADAIGAEKAVTLKYQNSGDTSGSREQVVGYGAMALYDTAEDNPVKDKKEQEASLRQHSESLTPEQKKALLRIARQTLEAVSRNQEPQIEIPNDPVLKEKRGCFVTLTHYGALRGCIGRFEPDEPLYGTICEMARAAAMEDPRFPPVRPDEVDDLEIEITVFPENPRKRIKDISEIEIGRHGLYIQRGPFGGTLLPQVATARQWDRKTFLEQTCLKAHLPKDAWKDPETEVYIYPGEIFHEEK